LNQLKQTVLENKLMDLILKKAEEQGCLSELLEES
jgi:hypothetical protein